jgi:hypothetical protein
VHSSTSNSNDRIPALAYRSEWLAILLLTAILLGGTEFLMRWRGFQPSVVDSKVFWSQHRDRVYTEGGRKRIVIAGDSRAQTGIDPAILHRMFPEFEVVHLAIDGTPGYEVAEDLCYDGRFDGVVLLITDATMLHPGDSSHGRAREYVAYYHGEFQTAAALDKRVNVSIGTALQSVAAVLSPSISVREVLLQGPRIRPLYAPMLENRFRPNMYRSMLTDQELARIREKRTKEVLAESGIHLDPVTFRKIVTGGTRRMSEALRSRGGELVLVQMPTKAEQWTVGQSIAPKTQFWDSIAIWIPIQTVHFMDHKELSSFDCPDLSHLDASDVPEFTRRLAGVLRKQVALLNGHPTPGRPA